MRIGFDIDNVLYDFVSAFQAYVCAPRKPAKRWEFYEDMGYSLDEFLDLYAAGVDGGMLLSRLAPEPEAVASLERLTAAGHTIHLITDRFMGQLALVTTAQWLRDWAIPYTTFTQGADKTILAVDAAIDDKPANVDAWRAVGCKAFLLDCGRSDQVGHPHLVRSFWEFEAEIEQMTKGIGPH